MRFVPTGKVKFSALLIPLVIIVAIICQSCGTAHHFVPHEPLDKRQWQLSITWHYGLNGLDPPTVIPDFNAYIGIGKSQNLGVNTNFPFLISHLTYVNYQPKKVNSRWAFYGHLNLFWGFQRNPYFELGAMYSKSSDDIHQTFSLGLGYGRTSYIRPIIPLEADFRKYNLTKFSRLMPVVKYKIYGREFGFSINHYFGSTKNAYAPILDSIKNFNDTILVINSNEVDTVIEDENTLLIQYKDSTIVTLSKRIPHFEEKPFVKFMPSGKWRFGNYDFYNLISNSIEDTTRIQILININELLEQFANQEIVYITRFPNELPNKFSFISQLFQDNSIAIGKIFNPR